MPSPRSATSTTDTTSTSRRTNVSGDDAFARLYSAVESDIEAARQKAELASKEKSRASAIGLNSEIRRTKARLLKEVPKLQRLAVRRSLAEECEIISQEVPGAERGLYTEAAAYGACSAALQQLVRPREHRNKEEW